MEEQNRKTIAIINFLRKFISVFLNLFFNIYVLKIVDDLGLIIKYNLVGIIFEFIFVVIIMKIINSKNAKYIYNSSFLLLIILIGILMLTKENICNYVYIFRILLALERTAYSGPYELMIIGSNSNKSMSSFLANLNILSSIATILTPVFSGYIIQEFSYMMLFVLLLIEAFIIIYISTKITKIQIEDKPVDLKGFLNKTKKYEKMKNIYRCMFFRRISSQGAITDLLPIVMFLRVGSELSVGAYNSLLAIISVIALQILKYTNKKEIPKKFYTPFGIIIFISSIILVYKTNFITFIIYYILMNSLGTIIESESCSAVYEVIKDKDLNSYRREHIITFNIYMCIGQIISYSLSYLLYNYFCNVEILSLIIAILMFFLIISCIYLRKTEKDLVELRN